MIKLYKIRGGRMEYGRVEYPVRVIVDLENKLVGIVDNVEVNYISMVGRKLRIIVAEAGISFIFDKKVEFDRVLSVGWNEDEIIIYLGTVMKRENSYDYGGC